MQLIISKRALRQIERINQWWLDHRAAAPSMFLDELAAAERLLREHPEAGLAFATHRTGVVRRVLLRGTKYHLYYRYRVDRAEIVVLPSGARHGASPRSSDLKALAKLGERRRKIDRFASLGLTERRLELGVESCAIVLIAVLVLEDREAVDRLEVHDLSLRQGRWDVQGQPAVPDERPHGGHGGKPILRVG